MEDPISVDAGYSAHRLPRGGFLGALPTGPLIGRERELDRLRGAMAAVETGEGRLMLPAGEPGVGKTRLAQEVSLIAQEQGFVVVAGRCYEAQQATPFFPWLDLLTALYQVAPSDVRAVVPDRFPSLATLLPDQRLPVPVPALHGAEDQERLFWSVAGFVLACAAQHPLALLLDDVHWADSSSLELLQRLARQTRSHAVLLLVTYRDVEVGRQHPLETTLSELTRQELVQRIAVRHLPEEDTAQLVAAVLKEQEISAEFASLLYERTEGNPFMVQQVLQVLVERGDLFRKDGMWDRRAIEEIAVPESIRSAVGQRVGRLSQEAQQVLGEASVLGQTFLFDDLAQMDDRSELTVEHALEHALQIGLIRDVERDRYAFDHALTQQVLYDALTTWKRRRLHLAAGQALEQLPERKQHGRVAELARHFQQGDDPERAIRYAMRAGELAEEMYAYQEAERHYRTARELAQELEDRRSGARAGEELARVLWHLNRWPEALSVGEETLTLYQVLEDIEGEMRVAQIVSIAWPPHPTDALIPRLEDLLARAPSTPSRARTRLMAGLAWTYRLSGRIVEADHVAEQAIELAEALGDGRAEMDALDTLALGFQTSGRLEEARAAFEKLTSMAERLNDTYWLARSLIFRGWAGYVNGECEQAVQLTQRGLEVARRSGSVEGIAVGTINLGEIAFDAGKWVDAERYFLEAVPLGQVVSTTTDPAAHLLYLQLLRGDQGTISELEHLAVDPASWAARYLAEWEIMRGQPARARDLLEAALEAGIMEHFRRGWEALLAESYMDLGDLERADALLSPIVEQPVRVGYPADAIQCRRVMGMLRAAQGRWDEARGYFQRALSEAEDFPFVQGQVRHHFGIALQNRGEYEAAQAQLEAALGLFDRLGAHAYAARTRSACSITADQTDAEGAPRAG